MSLPRLHAEVSAIVSVSSSLPRTTPSRWFLIPLVMQHGTQGAGTARIRPSSAQNNMAAVSALGSTVWVLIRRLNSSCRRSIAFVVLALRHWVGGRRVKVKRRSAGFLGPETKRPKWPYGRGPFHQTLGDCLQANSREYWFRIGSTEEAASVAGRPAG